MSERRWLYHFRDPVPEGCGTARALLGGKGASLQEMSRAGLRVPPGFTLTTDCCRAYFDSGGVWPDGLGRQVREAMGRLERETGRRFGRGATPLLVSVRSGAAVSMPGMMDTILNCGLHPALAAETGEGPAFWSTYIQFIRMFARTARGVADVRFDEALAGERAAGEVPEGGPSRALAEAHVEVYRELTGRDFPVDPWTALHECIDAVFGSWENERAVAYRRRHGITGLAGTAVNVQAMFPSQVSGIAFTQDPNDLAAGRMILEASYGLGEAVVSGDVEPDRFIVARENLSIRESHIGHKACIVSAFGGAGESCDPDAPSLTEDEVRQVAEMALRIEAHFGHPVDVEWGLAGEELACLQARPIRGLEIAEDVEIGRREMIHRLRAMADGRRRVWVGHNLDETLRHPTPLTWSIVRRFMSGSGGFGRMYRDFGYRPSERVVREGFLELIGGRVYADPDRLAELFWDAMPLAYDVDALVEDRSLLDRAPTAFDPDRADARFLAHLPANLASMVRASRRMKRGRKGARERFETEVLPPYLAWVEAKRGEDLDALSDAALPAELEARRARVMDEFGPESLKPGFFGGMAFDQLAARLVQLMGREEGEAVASTLVRGLEGDTTFEQDAMLWRVGRGEADMADFLEAYGHRAVGEMELAVPRWREDPSYVEQMASRFAAHGRNPVGIHAENVARREAAEAKLPSLLAEWGGSVLSEPLHADLADAQALLPYREAGKHYLMMGYALVREVIEALARRWDLGPDVYYLTFEELAGGAVDREAMADRLRARRIRRESAKRLDMPDVIDSADLEGLGLAPPVEAAAELKGAAVASGVATGTARIVLEPGAAADLGDDYVLVCPSTDPGWTPLFVAAVGLVVERGGVLSHGAIVARDFGIPAVVAAGATRRIPEGARVRVDGNHGRISILER